MIETPLSRYADDARAAAAAIAATLPSRLTNAVSQRLGTDVRFVRWQEHAPTGAQIPVFAVPAHALTAARALGLTCEAA